MSKPGEVVENRRDIRFVEVRGHKYLRAEDVATLMREFGATEETDVRNRMNELVNNIEVSFELDDTRI